MIDLKMETVRHLIIQDSLTDEDIGIATIRYGSVDNHIKHWITMPDGTVRLMYKSRSISESDADILIAFDSLPELEVSYRPISKHMDNREDAYLLIMLLFFLLLMVYGVMAGIVIIMGIMNIVADSPISFYSSIVLILGTAISSFQYFVVVAKARSRWCNITPDDEKMNTLTSEKYEREKIEKNNKERLEIRSVLAAAQAARDLVVPENKGLTIKVS